MPDINLEYLNCFGKLHKRPKPPTAIVIHHTCTNSPETTRKSLSRKGYSTHFEVDRLGHIYQYAPVEYVCCHCGSANIHAIGIDVTHPINADFPERQVRSVADLVHWLCMEYKIPQVVHESLCGIYPHRAIGNTECPQNFPMSRLNAQWEAEQ